MRRQRKSNNPILATHTVSKRPIYPTFRRILKIRCVSNHIDKMGTNSWQSDESTRSTLRGDSEASHTWPNSDRPRIPQSDLAAQTHLHRRSDPPAWLQGEDDKHVNINYRKKRGI